MSTLQRANRGWLILTLLVSGGLVGCGSSSSDSDSTDTTPTEAMVTKIAVDPLTRLVSGEATVSGFDADALHIHEGAVGFDGPVIIGLEQDPADSDRFVVPDGARLSGDQYNDFLAGNLYFNSHRAGGASVVREQIEGITIDTSNFSINDTTGDASGYIMVSGFTPTVAHIHTGFAGTSGGIAVTLEADATTAGRFNAPTGASVTLTDYAAGKLYFNVHSADFTGGHIREQIEPSGVQVLGVEISGEQVAPTPISGGGTATAYVTVDETSGAIEAVLNLHNISDSTNAHIHDGIAGVNGGVLQGFTVDPGDSTTWTISSAPPSSAPPLSPANLAKLLAGETYINVHTVAVGTGAARGQIEADGTSFAIVPLTAEEATTNTGGTSAGTATGWVTVNENVTPATVKSQLVYSGITPTLAHIHTGAAGTTGGVVQGYTLDTGAGTGSIDATLTTQQVSDYNDDNLYINLHTSLYPNGELRGQIRP
jgi:hypothetical protein